MCGDSLGLSGPAARRVHCSRCCGRTAAAPGPEMILFLRSFRSLPISLDVHGHRQLCAAPPLKSRCSSTSQLSESMLYFLFTSSLHKEPPLRLQMSFDCRLMLHILQQGQSFLCYLGEWTSSSDSEGQSYCTRAESKLN